VLWHVSIQLINGFNKTKAAIFMQTMLPEGIPFFSAYFEIFLLRGHEILWFDYDGHIRGHLNSWIFKFNT